MTVEIDVKARELKVDDRLHDYIVSKVSKLERYVSGIQSVRVEMSHLASARQTEDRFVAQITVFGKGFVLRAEDRADEPTAAFDTAFDNIKRRVRRYKDKHYRGAGDRTSLGDAAMEELMAMEMEPEVEALIARRKKFLLMPMDEREAIEQSRLLGHNDFFVFFNVETNSVNVLYARRDGTFGLIETEMG
ncbi:MAG: ribosome-associated translation inhibitor RaiA [Chloroflexi bacterium]|nr:ribosome-associated translation inhibitor RaiA [Chloroflexota bacterium]